MKSTCFLSTKRAVNFRRSVEKTKEVNRGEYAKLMKNCDTKFNEVSQLNISSDVVQNCFFQFVIHNCSIHVSTSTGGKKTPCIRLNFKEPRLFFNLRRELSAALLVQCSIVIGWRSLNSSRSILIGFRLELRNTRLWFALGNFSGNPRLMY